MCPRVSLICVYLGSNSIDDGKQMGTCGYLLVMNSSTSKKKGINYNSILNVTVTELLHNRAITKMASTKLMLGHSEDYVSVSSYGLVHTVRTAMSFLIIGQPNYWHKTFLGGLGIHLAKESHTFMCKKWIKWMHFTWIKALLCQKRSSSRCDVMQKFTLMLLNAVSTILSISSARLKASSLLWWMSFPGLFGEDERSSSQLFVWCPMWSDFQTSHRYRSAAFLCYVKGTRIKKWIEFGYAM